ncbi:hypothetical protein D9757_005046 [Collybiopsis confluens]|uniref:Uncharacterized protein n=1 Tax=Collybiopsis confluens TaxID=2823264 RepID=A0A8H5HSS7_9AGAR|nr:hypothetical protein D9757_005046 [Collybiopsis confluens]
MTEYDYSPEAYDRYKAKLRSIDRWVHNTERYEPANPFMPTPAMPTARLPGSSDVSYSGSREMPQRSYTAPASRGSSSSSGAYGSSTNVYQHSSPQRYTQDYRYPYPASPPAPIPRPPHRSNTFHTPPQPPQPPKRSNTSPHMQVYDPRVGLATRVIYQPYAQPQSPSGSKGWLGKLFSGFRASSPSPAQSPTSPTGALPSRHSRSKSTHHNYRYDRDRERSKHYDERRSKSQSRSTKHSHSKHHKSRSSSL